MDTLKIILIAIGLIAVVVAGIWLIGIISALLWFALWIGLIGAIAYGGYKLFFEKSREKKQLDEKSPIVIAEMKDVDRTLEEYKRKTLPK
jgi:membrane protein implicated in regulation of membrane protease activity